MCLPKMADERELDSNTSASPVSAKLRKDFTLFKDRYRYALGIDTSSQPMTSSHNVNVTQCPSRDDVSTFSSTGNSGNSGHAQQMPSSMSHGSQESLEGDYLCSFSSASAASIDSAFSISTTSIDDERASGRTVCFQEGLPEEIDSDLESVWVTKDDHRDDRVFSESSGSFDSGHMSQCSSWDPSSSSLSLSSNTSSLSLSSSSPPPTFPARCVSSTMPSSQRSPVPSSTSTFHAHQDISSASLSFHRTIDTRSRAEFSEKPQPTGHTISKVCDTEEAKSDRGWLFPSLEGDKGSILLATSVLDSESRLQPDRFWDKTKDLCSSSSVRSGHGLDFSVPRELNTSSELMAPFYQKPPDLPLPVVDRRRSDSGAMSSEITATRVHETSKKGLPRAQSFDSEAASLSAQQDIHSSKTFYTTPLAPLGSIKSRLKLLSESVKHTIPKVYTEKEKAFITESKQKTAKEVSADGQGIESVFTSSVEKPPIPITPKPRKTDSKSSSLCLQDGNQKGAFVVIEEGPADLLMTTPANQETVNKTSQRTACQSSVSFRGKSTPHTNIRSLTDVLDADDPKASQLDEVMSVDDTSVIAPNESNTLNVDGTMSIQSNIRDKIDNLDPGSSTCLIGDSTSHQVDREVNDQCTSANVSQSFQTDLSFRQEENSQVSATSTRNEPCHTSGKHVGDEESIGQSSSVRGLDSVNIPLFAKHDNRRGSLKTIPMYSGPLKIVGRGRKCRSQSFDSQSLSVKAESSRLGIAPSPDVVAVGSVKSRLDVLTSSTGHGIQKAYKDSEKASMSESKRRAAFEVFQSRDAATVNGAPPPPPPRRRQGLAKNTKKGGAISSMINKFEKFKQGKSTRQNQPSVNANPSNNNNSNNSKSNNNSNNNNNSIINNSDNARLTNEPFSTSNNMSESASKGVTIPDSLTTVTYTTDTGTDTGTGTDTSKHQSHRQSYSPEREIDPIDTLPVLSVVPNLSATQDTSFEMDEELLSPSLKQVRILQEDTVSYSCKAQRDLPGSVRSEKHDITVEDVGEGFTNLRQNPTNSSLPLLSTSKPESFSQYSTTMLETISPSSATNQTLVNSGPTAKLEAVSSSLRTKVEYSSTSSTRLLESLSPSSYDEHHEIVHNDGDDIATLLLPSTDAILSSESDSTNRQDDDVSDFFEPNEEGIFVPSAILQQCHSETKREEQVEGLGLVTSDGGERLRLVTSDDEMLLPLAVTSDAIQSPCNHNEANRLGIPLIDDVPIGSKVQPETGRPNEGDTPQRAVRAKGPVPGSQGSGTRYRRPEIRTGRESPDGDEELPTIREEERRNKDWKIGVGKEGKERMVDGDDDDVIKGYERSGQKAGNIVDVEVDLIVKEREEVLEISRPTREGKEESLNSSDERSHDRIRKEEKIHDCHNENEDVVKVIGDDVKETEKKENMMGHGCELLANIDDTNDDETKSGNNIGKEVDENERDEGECFLVKNETRKHDEESWITGIDEEDGKETGHRSLLDAKPRGYEETEFRGSAIGTSYRSMGNTDATSSGNHEGDCNFSLSKYYHDDTCSKTPLPALQESVNIPTTLPMSASSVEADVRKETDVSSAHEKERGEEQKENEEGVNSSNFLVDTTNTTGLELEYENENGSAESSMVQFPHASVMSQPERNGNDRSESTRRDTWKGEISKTSDELEALEFGAITISAGCGVLDADPWCLAVSKIPNEGEETRSDSMHHDKEAQDNIVEVSVRFEGDDDEGSPAGKEWAQTSRESASKNSSRSNEDALSSCDNDITDKDAFIPMGDDSKLCVNDEEIDVNLNEVELRESTEREGGKGRVTSPDSGCMVINQREIRDSLKTVSDVCSVVHDGRKYTTMMTSLNGENDKAPLSSSPPPPPPPPQTPTSPPTAAYVEVKAESDPSISAPTSVSGSLVAVVEMKSSVAEGRAGDLLESLGRENGVNSGDRDSDGKAAPGSVMSSARKGEWSGVAGCTLDYVTDGSKDTSLRPDGSSTILETKDSDLLFEGIATTALENKDSGLHYEKVCSGRGSGEGKDIRSSLCLEDDEERERKEIGFLLCEIGSGREREESKDTCPSLEDDEGRGSEVSTEQNKIKDTEFGLESKDNDLLSERGTEGRESRKISSHLPTGQSMCPDDIITRGHPGDDVMEWGQGGGGGVIIHVALPGLGPTTGGNGERRQAAIGRCFFKDDCCGGPGEGDSDGQVDLAGDDDGHGGSGCSGGSGDSGAGLCFSNVKSGPLAFFTDTDDTCYVNQVALDLAAKVESPEVYCSSNVNDANSGEIDFVEYEPIHQHSENTSRIDSISSQLNNNNNNNDDEDDDEEDNSGISDTVGCGVSSSTVTSDGLFESRNVGQNSDVQCGDQDNYSSRDSVTIRDSITSAISSAVDFSESQNDCQISESEHHNRRELFGSESVDSLDVCAKNDDDDGGGGGDDRDNTDGDVVDDYPHENYVSSGKAAGYCIPSLKEEEEVEIDESRENISVPNVLEESVLQGSVEECCHGNETNEESVVNETKSQSACIEEEKPSYCGDNNEDTVERVNSVSCLSLSHRSPRHLDTFNPFSPLRRPRLNFPLLVVNTEKVNENTGASHTDSPPCNTEDSIVKRGDVRRGDDTDTAVNQPSRRESHSHGSDSFLNRVGPHTLQTIIDFKVEEEERLAATEPDSEDRKCSYQAEERLSRCAEGESSCDLSDISDSFHSGFSESCDSFHSAEGDSNPNPRDLMPQSFYDLGPGRRRRGRSSSIESGSEGTREHSVFDSSNRNVSEVFHVRQSHLANEASVLVGDERNAASVAYTHDWIDIGHDEFDYPSMIFLGIDHQTVGTDIPQTRLTTTTTTNSGNDDDDDDDDEDGLPIDDDLFSSLDRPDTNDTIPGVHVSDYDYGHRHDHLTESDTRETSCFPSHDSISLHADIDAGEFIDAQIKTNFGEVEDKTNKMKGEKAAEAISKESIIKPDNRSSRSGDSSTDQINGRFESMCTDGRNLKRKLNDQKKGKSSSNPKINSLADEMSLGSPGVKHVSDKSLCPTGWPSTDSRPNHTAGASAVESKGAPVETAIERLSPKNCVDTTLNSSPAESGLRHASEREEHYGQVNGDQRRTFSVSGKSGNRLVDPARSGNLVETTNPLARVTTNGDILEPCVGGEENFKARSPDDTGAFSKDGVNDVIDRSAHRPVTYFDSDNGITACNSANIDVPSATSGFPVVPFGDPAGFGFGATSVVKNTAQKRPEIRMLDKSNVKRIDRRKGHATPTSVFGFENKASSVASDGISKCSSNNNVTPTTTGAYPDDINSGSTSSGNNKNDDNNITIVTKGLYELKTFSAVLEEQKDVFLAHHVNYLERKVAEDIRRLRSEGESEDGEDSYGLDPGLDCSRFDPDFGHSNFDPGLGCGDLDYDMGSDLDPARRKSSIENGWEWDAFPLESCHFSQCVDGDEDDADEGEGIDEERDDEEETEERDQHEEETEERDQHEEETEERDQHEEETEERDQHEEETEERDQHEEETEERDEHEETEERDEHEETEERDEHEETEEEEMGEDNKYAEEEEEEETEEQGTVYQSVAKTHQECCDIEEFELTGKGENTKNDTIKEDDKRGKIREQDHERGELKSEEEENHEYGKMLDRREIENFQELQEFVKEEGDDQEYVRAKREQEERPQTPPKCLAFETCRKEEIKLGFKGDEPCLPLLYTNSNSLSEDDGETLPAATRRHTVAKRDAASSEIFELDTPDGQAPTEMACCPFLTRSVVDIPTALKMEEDRERKRALQQRQRERGERDTETEEEEEVEEEDEEDEEEEEEEVEYCSECDEEKGKGDIRQTTSLTLMGISNIDDVTGNSPRDEDPLTLNDECEIGNLDTFEDDETGSIARRLHLTKSENSQEKTPGFSDEDSGDGEGETEPNHVFSTPTTRSPDRESATVARLAQEPDVDFERAERLLSVESPPPDSLVDHRHDVIMEASCSFEKPFKKAAEYVGDIDDTSPEDGDDDDNDTVLDEDGMERDELDAGDDDFDDDDDDSYYEECFDQVQECDFVIERGILRSRHDSYLSDLELYSIEEEEEEEEEEDEEGTENEEVGEDGKGKRREEFHDGPEMRDTFSAIVQAPVDSDTSDGIDTFTARNAARRTVTWADQSWTENGLLYCYLQGKMEESSEIANEQESILAAAAAVVRRRQNTHYNPGFVTMDIDESIGKPSDCIDMDEYKRRSLSMDKDSLDDFDADTTFHESSSSTPPSVGIESSVLSLDRHDGSADQPQYYDAVDELRDRAKRAAAQRAATASVLPLLPPTSSSSFSTSPSSSICPVSIFSHASATNRLTPSIASSSASRDSTTLTSSVSTSGQPHAPPPPWLVDLNSIKLEVPDEADHGDAGEYVDEAYSNYKQHVHHNEAGASLGHAEQQHQHKPNQQQQQQLQRQQLKEEIEIKQQTQQQTQTSDLDKGSKGQPFLPRRPHGVRPASSSSLKDFDDSSNSSFEGRIDCSVSFSVASSTRCTTIVASESSGQDTTAATTATATTNNTTAVNVSDKRTATSIPKGSSYNNSETSARKSGPNVAVATPDVISSAAVGGEYTSGVMAEGGEATEVEVLLESPTSGLHRISSEMGFMQQSSTEVCTSSSSGVRTNDPYKLLERSQSDASLLTKDLERLTDDDEVHLTAAESSSGQNISECNRVYLDLSRAEVFEKVELGENGGQMMRTSSGRLLETIPQDEELKTGDLSYVYASHRSFSTESSSSLEDLNAYGKGKSKDGSTKFKSVGKGPTENNSSTPLASKSNLKSSFQIYSHSLKQKVRQLQMGSLPEQINALSELNVLMEQAWSMPVYGSPSEWLEGKDLAYELCDILRTESALDIIVGNLISANKELMKVSARLLEQSLTTSNRRQIADNGIEMVVKMTRDMMGNCELAQTCTGILESLFKTSEETCTSVIKLGGLDVITYWCRCNDRVTLKNCAIALSNLALYGGGENQQEMTKHKVPEWLFPLAFVEDDSVRYYALLAIGVLVSNKEIENDVISSGTLALVLPFVDSHDPAEFAQRDMSHRHGRSPGWLKRLIPVLSSKREEAQSLAAFHFVMEAGIKSEQGRKEVLYKIGAVEPLKWLASTPNRVASRLAGQALRIIGEEIPHKLSQQVPLWTSDDVTYWIAQVGFSPYVDVFQACQIDGDLLLRLSEEDLRDSLDMPCSVTRKRFLRELRDLKISSDYTSCDPSMLGSWLRNVGEDMAQYTYQMLHAGLDRPLLGSINNQHLQEDCGVNNGIHRMKILAKINAVVLPPITEYKSNAVSPSSGSMDPIEGFKSSSKPPIDVFISYRRSNGSQLASLLKVHLQLRGFAVFIDIERLRAGKFDESLLESVKNAKNFIIVLTQNSLDRCMGDDIKKDWVHREIVAALDASTKIIPVMDNFRWPSPDSLPEDMRNIVYFNGIRWIHDYQDACVDKLETFLRGDAPIQPHFPISMNGPCQTNSNNISSSNGGGPISFSTPTGHPVATGNTPPVTVKNPTGLFESPHSPPYQRAQGMSKHASVDVDSPTEA